MENENKLIAEFMGYKVVDKPKVVNGENFFEYIDENGNYTYCNSLLKYDISWDDWLMPVVDKIEREHKANFRIKCTWNEFTEYSIHQVIVNIEQGEMSKDKSCIYDSKKIYDYIGDAVKCKREATYNAVVEFIKTYKNK
jgi:hypothetical protein|tara:strand:+ start:654 stop:1070 length:417 start_codon:yes stop_codon:yes gene_type:complete